MGNHPGSIRISAFYPGFRGTASSAAVVSGTASGASRVWVRITNKPQVLVHVSIYQGSISPTARKKETF